MMSHAVSETPITYADVNVISALVDSKYGSNSPVARRVHQLLRYDVERPLCLNDTSSTMNHWSPLFNTSVHNEYIPSSQTNIGDGGVITSNVSGLPVGIPNVWSNVPLYKEQCSWVSHNNTRRTKWMNDGSYTNGSGEVQPQSLPSSAIPTYTYINQSSAPEQHYNASPAIQSHYHERPVTRNPPCEGSTTNSALETNESSLITKDHMERVLYDTILTNRGFATTQQVCSAMRNGLGGGKTTSRQFNKRFKNGDFNHSYKRCRRLNTDGYVLIS